jgi:hypothetical protein
LEVAILKLEPWQQLVLDTLRELSDASFQTRVWVRCENEISSPTEAVNQLFDDSGLGDLLEGELVFSEKADLLLKELSRHVDTINFEQPIEELLSDDRWPKLRQLAADAMSEVNAALGTR